MRACVFNRDWTVRKKTGSVGLTSGNEEKKIDLPYDAMICEARSADAVGSFRTGYFPNGVWEFKKSFFVPEDAAAQKLVFRFDGVYAHSCVYINGDYAGGHTYGYSQFFVDTDGLLKYGQDNELTVIARSVDDARWYSGCGIYWDVYLLTASRIYIPPASLVISTPEIGVDETRACVTVPVKNGEALQKTVRVEAAIFNQTGNSVSRGSTPLTITGGESATAYLNLYMTEPKLWDLDAPYLYQCRVTVIGPDGEVLDEETAEFGLRSIFVSPSKGFQLNGKTVKLRGACIHHDNGPLGAVSTACVEERRIRRLKEAGFNAIRCAHNPAGQALLNACDKLGMLVMNEAFDTWTRPKVNYDYSMDFSHHWQEDVDAFVRSSVNHPSVVIYSIGNEIPETGSPNGARFGRAIAQRVKSLDPSRPTLNSINGMMSVMSILESLRDSPSEEQRGGDINQQMSDLREVMSQVMNLDVITHATEEAYACVDIAGYNYMDVRYEQDHARFPNRVICGTETYPPRIAQNWALIKECSHVIGDFTWTGWDYIGEAGIGLVKCTQPPAEYGVSAPYPSLTAYCGDLTICGERRPVSFYREIVFGLRKEPYIAVIRPESMGVPTVTTPWSWSDSVSSWSFDGLEGHVLTVEVYTDAGEAALYLNGELIGQEKTIACKAEFSVPYRSGELTALAVRDGIEKERFSLRSAVGERHLVLRQEAPAASVGEYTYIRLSLEDENGNPFTRDRPNVRINVMGAACLAAFGNDDPLTEENFFDSVRTLYDGTALVILKPVTAGRVRLRAEADGLCAECEIDVVADVSIAQRKFGGVDCELLTPAAAKSDGIIFYIHGGAFAYGSALSSREYASVLADELGMRVVTISYRLAPEHKWPAGSDDCFEAYQGILEGFPGCKTVLVGESAGGTMVLVTALRAKAAGIQMPAGIVAFSPCTNLAEDLPSRKKNEGAMVVPYANVMELLQELYLEDGVDTKRPDVSPFYGDYSGFPHMYFTADRDEVLFDDSALLVPKLKEQGVEVTFDIYEDTFHSFPTIGKVCPESAEAVKRTCDFISGCFS